MEFNQKSSLSMALWSATFILAVYTAHGMVGVRRKTILDPRLRRFFHSRKGQVTLVTSAMIHVLLLMTAPSVLWLPGAAFFFFAFFYDQPLGRSRPLGFKQVPLLKAPAVAFAVLILVAVFPLLWSNQKLSSDPLVLTALFFHLLFNTLMGDLRDHSIDAAKGVKSWPVLMGFGPLRITIVLASPLLAIGLWGEGVSWPWLAPLFYDGFIAWSTSPDTKKQQYHWADVAHFLPLGVLALI